MVPLIRQGVLERPVYRLVQQRLAFARRIHAGHGLARMSLESCTHGPFGTTLSFDARNGVGEQGSPVILAGDIGGTKTDLALFDSGSDARRPSIEGRFSTRDFQTLDALLDRFLASKSVTPKQVVLGIAGPVRNNRCETTNLPWTVDGDAMAERLGSRVTLLNDLAAAAWGVSTLGEQDIKRIKPGVDDGGPRALIAPGTGLGEAIMARLGTHWEGLPSEGGHADFASRNPLEDELLAWLRARYGHVSYERVLSGPGIADLYRFLSDAGRGREADGFGQRFRDARDPAVLVTQSAVAGDCERARLAMELFVDVCGAEAGNLALKGFATGGVYLGGGIAPRIQSLLHGDRFARAFVDKGRLRPVLEAIPVSLVMDPRTALWGASEYARAHP